MLIILSLLLLSSPLYGQKTGVLYLYGTKLNALTFSGGNIIFWETVGDSKDNPKYEGEVKNGEPNGTGTLTVTSANYGIEDKKYVGEWKDGLPNGQGTLTSSGRYKYVGEWKDGKEHGQGTWTDSTDGEKYVGEFKDGKYHGQGTNTKSNVYKYVGEWKDGKYHGQGTITYETVTLPSFGERYVGEFKDGHYNGQGTITYPNGTKYVGEFDFLPKGQGTLIFPNGIKGEGEFRIIRLRYSKPWNVTIYDKDGKYLDILNGKWNNCKSCEDLYLGKFSGGLVKRLLRN
jgi:hypothetical protein